MLLGDVKGADDCVVWYVEQRLGVHPTELLDKATRLLWYCRMGLIIFLIVGIIALPLALAAVQWFFILMGAAIYATVEFVAKAWKFIASHRKSPTP